MISNLIQRAELLRIHSISNSQGTIRIATILTLTGILMIGIFSISGYWQVGILQLMLGFVIASFFSIIHYAAHASLFKSKMANRWVGRFFGLILLSNFSLYRVFHMQHHRYTTVAGDSEPVGEIQSVAHYLFCALNWDYWFAFFRLSVLSVFDYFPEFIQKNQDQDAVQLNSVLVLIAIFVALILTLLFPMTLLTVYWIPLQLAYTFNFWLVIGEHGVGESTSDSFRNTRSFSGTTPLFQFVHFNSHLHAEHHLYPSVPPWNLDTLEDRLGFRFDYHDQSYWQFNRDLILDLIRRNRWYGRLNPPPLIEGRFSHFFYPVTRRAA